MARPRNMDLPGMENRRIPDLHEKGTLLEAVRTERMELTKKETDLAQEVQALMEKYKKTEKGYHCDGLDIEYIPGEMPKPKIKVRVALDPEATDTGEQPADIGDGDNFPTDQVQ